MPRNTHGFLKATALINGLADVYAVVKGGVTCEVRLAHDVLRGGFVTTYSVGEERTEWQFGKNLPLAREKFRELASALGGRV